jgi:fructose-1,6-bisphosphatase/sedoheptulose 1,7-bisphosphatase-like protein
MNVPRALTHLMKKIEDYVEKKAIAHEPKKGLSFMEKLQVEAKEGTKRFTIDLRESVHRKLSILSAKTGRSKADIIRMVLDDVLKDVEE